MQGRRVGCRGGGFHQDTRKAPAQDTWARIPVAKCRALSTELGPESAEAVSGICVPKVRDCMSLVTVKVLRGHPLRHAEDVVHHMYFNTGVNSSRAWA